MRRTHHSLGNRDTLDALIVLTLLYHGLQYYTIYTCITRYFVCELIKLTIVTKNGNVKLNILMKLKKLQLTRVTMFQEGSTRLIVNEHFLGKKSEREERRRHL